MKRARTVEEMRFAASLEPCPSCGIKQLGTLELQGSGRSWTYRGKCPQCGTARTFQFTSIGDPTRTRIGQFDLGPLRSELIAPEQFLAILDEATGRLPADPSTLTPDLRDVAADQLRRALTCVAELLKLLPLGVNQMPGSTDPRLQRSWLSGEFKRLRVLTLKYAPPPSIEPVALQAHAEYVQRGAKGPGQLKIVGASLVRENYGAVQLSFAEIARSDLTCIDLAEARLEYALLEEDTFAFALLRGANLINVVIRGGTWTSINASSAKLNAAEIDRAVFSRSEMEGTLWYDARVTGARFDGVRFGSAVFDRALFQGCSFIDASFSLLSSKPEPTSDGAQFIDCDLTGTEWTGRNLRGTTFLRCKLAGATGVPTSTDGLVVNDCDVRADAFVAQLQHPLN